jgi:hypothetical protein
MTGKPTVTIDGVKVAASAVGADRSWTASFVRGPNGWSTGSPEPGLAKIHESQGPIDDAFMDRFVMVRPTGKPISEKTDQWVGQEMKHSQVHWRRQFRGEAQIKDDTQITDADIASSNLILWGDPSSNQILKRIADKLPIRWSEAGVQVGDKSHSVGNHVVAMIYPNPLNPKKYVVLNSGFTFREYDYLNNARQIPKLPDWAVLDVERPTTSRRPAGIVDAAFFGERWELTAERK